MSGIVTFGKKHRGRSLAMAVLRDPDWFFWAIEQDAFDRDPGLLPEAMELAWKARNIKIPRPNPNEWCIRYHTQRGKFATFDIIELITLRTGASPTTFLSDRLDLAVPRILKQYDKRGCQLLLKDFKYHFLGSSDAKLTRAWCEEFFANTDNFIGERALQRPGLWQPDEIGPDYEFVASDGVLVPSASFPKPKRARPTFSSELKHCGKDIDEINEQEWSSYLEQEASMSRAEERATLESASIHNWYAANRLAEMIEEEEMQQASERCCSGGT